MDKVTDLSIFGRVVRDDNLQNIGISRYGVCSAFAQFGLFADLIQKAWNNKRNIALALSVSKGFRIDIEEDDSAAKALEKIRKGLSAYNLIGWCHMCTSQVSTFYQMIAMSQLKGPTEGRYFVSSRWEMLSPAPFLTRININIRSGQKHR